MKNVKTGGVLRGIGRALSLLLVTLLCLTLILLGVVWVFAACTVAFGQYAIMVKSLSFPFRGVFIRQTNTPTILNTSASTIMRSAPGPTFPKVPEEVAQEVTPPQAQK